MPENPCEVQLKIAERLHQHIIDSPKPGTPTIKEIAFKMGVSESLIYKTLAGEIGIRLEDFPRLYQFSGNPLEALKYLVWQCDTNLAVTPIQSTHKPNGSLEEESEDITILHARFLQDKREALRDGKLDEGEILKLKDDVLDMRIGVDALLKEIDAYNGKAITQYPGGAHVARVQK